MEILLKNLLFVTPFSIVVLLVPACFSGNLEFGSEAGQNADLQAGGEFYNSQYGFRIVTPKDWVVPPIEGRKFGAGSIGYAAFDPSKSAQVSVFVEDLSSIDPPWSLEEYVRINKSNAQINFRFEELARRRLIIDENIDTWEVLWTRESPEVDGEKGKWLIFLKEGNGFVINAFSDEPLLSISLVAVLAVVGITRMSSSVPTAEATHQTDVVILGCGPDEEQSTYLVESYHASALAPGLGKVVSCAQALVVLTDLGFSVAGMVGITAMYGDGFLHSYIPGYLAHKGRRLRVRA